MKEKAERRLYRKQIQSPIGTICLEADEETLVSLYILESEVAARWERSEEEEKDTESFVQADSGRGTEILVQTENQLREYFLGQRTEFDIPIKEKGTEFQRKVWSALRKIPYGETRTYGEVAQMIGNPKACRAVGGANNRNPIMILTPCHRVVGADGSLVGFGGGLEAKRYLLELERTVCEMGDKEREKMGDQKIEGYDRPLEVKESELEETQAVYSCKRQGDYTLEDYYAWPKEQRIELIDGHIFKMDAPTVSHQMVGFEICVQLNNYINSKKGFCLPLISPVDVQLDQDERTMLQPDVLVVCDRSKVINRCIYGAPDFIVEVLSESSARRDTVIKLGKYKKAGVKEYWIVDLDSKTVTVHDFANEKVVNVYGMDGMIPVGVFEGQCQIDFAVIYEKVRFLLEP